MLAWADLASRIMGNEDCISGFPAHYEAMLASEVGPVLEQRLDALEWDLPLLAIIIGDDQKLRAILDASDEGDHLVLHASENEKYGEEPDEALRANTLRERLKRMVSDKRSLVIRLGDRDYVAIGMSEAMYGTRWMAVEA